MVRVKDKGIKQFYLPPTRLIHTCNEPCLPLLLLFFLFMQFVHDSLLYFIVPIQPLAAKY